MCIPDLDKLLTQLDDDDALFQKVLFLTASYCTADVNRSPNLQRFNIDNLEKWREYLEENQSQKDMSKVPWKYFQYENRNPESDIISDPNDSIMFDEYFTDNDLLSSMPYGIQNARDLSSRSAHNSETVYKTTFQSLCPSLRRTVFLNMTGIEYRPDHYEEVLCIHGYTNIQEYNPTQNKVCSQAGFSCIQLSRTIYLTRRSSSTDCWESESRKVLAGCECMWPRHHLGDIGAHHYN